MDQNSVQVDGQGEAFLKDIQFSTKYFSDVPDEEVRQLIEQQTNLQDELRLVQETIARAKAEKVFMDNIAARLTKGTEKTLELEPDKWMKMVTFYRSKHDALDHEIHASDISQKQIQDELEKTGKLIRELAHRRQKSRNQVIVTVLSEKKTELILQLKYLVNGPGWTPTYNIRVSSAEKKMTLEYQALIRQCTTESWEDVELKLSTARPQISGEAPELNPWYIDIFKPLPPPSMKRKSSGVMAALAKTDMATPAPMAGADEFEADMVVPAVAVETQTTSVIFTVSGSHTILSDNKEHKAVILIKEFPAEFKYETTPKLTPFAFLKAKTKNHTDFPLLPGKSSIYMDSHFVANAAVILTAPGEEFITSLGIDEGVKVEHKLIKKYRKDEGVLSKKTVYIYEYQIKIKNNKTTEETVTVFDQYPISLNQDIEIALISPKYKENTEALKKNDLQIFEWTHKIKSAEEIILPVTFSVEYPQGVNVTGLI